MTPDQAFEAFRDANPFPVVPIVRSGDALEVLAVARGEQSVAQSEPRVVELRRGLLLAAAVFIGVLLVGGTAFLLVDEAGDVVDEPLLPPIETTSTVETTSSIPQTTMPDPVPSPALQADLDQFVAAYNSGLFEAVESLIEPTVRRTAQWDFNPVDSQTMERVAALYEIESQLNTSISLVDCEMLGESRARCTLLREDELTRTLNLEPQNDGRITLQFSAGSIVAWDEQRPFRPDYNELAVVPFVQWVVENHPELPHPHPCDGCPQWQTNIGLAEIIADLIDEWAATLS